MGTFHPSQLSTRQAQVADFTNPIATEAMVWAAWVTATLSGQMGQGSARLSACKVQNDDFFFF